MPRPRKLAEGDLLELSRTSPEDASFQTPLSGPRTTAYLLNKTAKLGVGGFLGRRPVWVRESG
eukprot:4556149-Lingulodinium_polyedra.AAC.1